jgi:dUTP pyrophosphatase
VSDVTGMPVAYTRMPHAAGEPSYATPGSSGADLHSAVDIGVHPGRFALVPTGIRIALEPGWEAQVRSRSGLAAKHGVFVLNSPGTIDSDYRGEIKVILMNASVSEVFKVVRGDRIAQLVFSRVQQGVFHPYSEENFNKRFDTKRGSDGFGSTGK